MNSHTALLFHMIVFKCKTQCKFFFSFLWHPTGSGKGKLSEQRRLKGGKSYDFNGMKATKYTIKFRVELDFGIPGALVIKSQHKQKFFLQSATLQTLHPIHFHCNSWIYPFQLTKANRVFFSNTVSHGTNLI